MQISNKQEQIVLVLTSIWFIGACDSDQLLVSAVTGGISTIAGSGIAGNTVANTTTPSQNDTQIATSGSGGKGGETTITTTTAGGSAGSSGEDTHIGGIGGGDGEINDAGMLGEDGEINDADTLGLPVEPILPDAPANCPTLTTGFVTIMSHDVAVQVQVWAGTKGSTPAPMMIYWHVTGGFSSEAVGGIGLPLSVADEITGAGGVIVSPQNTTRNGNNTGNAVWYTGDWDVADQLVACAFQQYNLDPRRIYTAGGSAGALQAGCMVYQRSNYLAASLPNSGGYATGGRLFQNPDHIPAIMTMHGGPMIDVVVVDFSQQSLFLTGDVATHGGFAVDCNHGGMHVGAPTSLKLAGWKFLLDHPFGVSPEPYTKGLPEDFPSYCRIITPEDAIENPDPLDVPDAPYE